MKKLARVSSTSRKYTEIILEDRQSILAQKSSRHLEPIVGDFVEYQIDGGDYVISEVKPRINCLYRSYGKKSKQLASNLDLLCIVTAAKNLCNTVFIDRVLSAANSENIPCCIIANKADLKEDFKEAEAIFSYYQSLGIDLLRISVKEKINLKEIVNLLAKKEYKTLAFTGISGVGKSSLINVLIPNAEARISEVSEQTGQGRQTTTQSFAYVYERKTEDLLLIDLPGIQNFGISHLSEDEVRHSFIEFRKLDTSCKFNNCKHINEPACAVRTAVENGDVAKFRYESYLNMLEELEGNRDY